MAAGSNVVSMSIGGAGKSQTQEIAYKRMFNEENVLLVAAAGNGANSDFSYPASYEYVMSVAAVKWDGSHANFSQYNDQVDIAAPGAGVKSTFKGGAYAVMTGTSMAVPHVAGVAALVWSLDTTRSAKEVWSALTQTALDKGNPGRDDYYGHGIVQAAAAALLLANDNFTLVPTASPTVHLPCINDPKGWFDIDGDVYGCEWYAIESYCELYGSGFQNFGKTANEACCVCGGGGIDFKLQTSSPAPSPTPSKLASSKPSAEPSSSPSEVCIDSPENWSDAVDNFNCNWYGIDDRCSLFGNNYENFGKTANQACCACGGGDDSSPSSPPTNLSISPSTPTPSNRPSKIKSDVPSMRPTKSPSVSPSSPPTPTPSNSPSKMKSDVPSIRHSPSLSPSSPPTWSWLWSWFL